MSARFLRFPLRIFHPRPGKLLEYVHQKRFLRWGNPMMQSDQSHKGNIVPPPSQEKNVNTAPSNDGNVPELAIQRFLRGTKSGNVMKLLNKKYGIKTKSHTKYSNLILFKYDQVESDMEEELVQDCRGIILDQANNWKIVAMAFRKFFNYNEERGVNVKIDWSSAQVQEKADGSLFLLYPYSNEWHVATSGSPQARGNFGTSKKTMAERFWELFEDQGMERPKVDCGLCFYFELTSPMHPILVKYNDDKLTVLGCRSLFTLKEESAQWASEYLKSPSSAVKTFAFSSIQDVITSFEKMDPFQQEGYIIVDGSGTRVKLKHPGYVAWHYSLRRFAKQHMFVNIARTMESSEVVATLPEYKEKLGEVLGRMKELHSTCLADYKGIENLDDETFRVEAAKTRCPAAMHHLRSGETGLRTFFKDMDLDALTVLLGYEGHDPNHMLKKEGTAI